MNEADQQRVLIVLQEQMRNQREWRKDVDRQLAQVSALPYRMDTLAEDLREVKTSLAAFIDKIDKDSKERASTKEQREGIRLSQGLQIVGASATVFGVVQALFLLLQKVVLK